jgi:hypothetical protein
MLYFLLQKINRSCSIEIKDKVEERFCFIFQKQWDNCIKKHVNANHGQIFKMFEEEVKVNIKVHYKNYLQRNNLQ